MSWDERLFDWGLKLYSKAVHGSPAPSIEEQNKALLDEMAPRLKIIASALSGKTREIKEAEVTGGLYGSTLLLPPQMAVLPNKERNCLAYIYRVAYSTVADDLGFVLPEAVKDSSEAQVLYSLLVAPAVRLELGHRYPSLCDLESELVNREISRRMQNSLDLRSRSSVFDLLVLQALSHPSQSGQQWFNQVFKVPIQDNRTAKKILSETLQPFVDSGPATQLKFPEFLSLIYPSAESETSLVKSSQDMPTKKGSLATGTEKKGKAREKVKEVKFSDRKEEENPILHVFEKLRTAAEYTGGRKSLDGSDELEEHLEALEELDLRSVIRTQETADSVYKADVMIDASVAELEDEDGDGIIEYSYDEWDELKREYKQGWCNVRESSVFERIEPVAAVSYVEEALNKNQRQIRELKLMFDEIKAERKWRNRQTEGSEIDLDAVVDRYVTLKSGHTPKDKLYLTRRRMDKDYATLVLLDSSLSTDSWIQNRRVMDILKESMLVLSEVVPSERIAVGAFYSNTRKDCRYSVVKEFEESWHPARYRLASLKPSGYTRIGPAVRHATHLLSQVPARKKLLLLISDGKPTDFDRYEGRYGIGDIRQAAREAAAQDIKTRALAIDVNAKFYLPQMFGAGNFQILPHPGMLSKSLAEVYSWLC